MKQPMYMTDLEERLGCDERGALRAEVNARLRALQAALRAELRGMHPRERYRQLEAASKAVDAALDALPLLQVPRL